MMIFIVSFGVAYALSIGGGVLYGFYRQRRKERKYDSGKIKINASEISLLIPFRNEETRISCLIESIKKLEKRPAKILFINDHSEDRGPNMIAEQLYGNVEIIHLPDRVQGKKRALRYGIEKCTTNYILTMDADVVIPPDYFNAIEQVEEADMYVLPAILKAENILEYFFEIDQVLINAANTSFAGWARPIISSGANFLYKRAQFNDADRLEEHVHMASGDDTYLLRDFRKAQLDVRVHSNPEISITTETPHTIKAFFSQRLRWIGKTKDVNDGLANAFGGIQLLFTLSFIGGAIALLVQGKVQMTVWLVLLKTFVDLITFLPYFLRINRFKTWLFIPVYQLIFPVYMMTILVLLPFYNPKWKGREIA